MTWGALVARARGRATHLAGDDALAAMGLERAACASIHTNLRASPMELCRVQPR